MVAAVADEFQKIGHNVVVYTFQYVPENCYSEILKNVKVVSLGTHIPKGNYLVNFILENRNAKHLAALIDKDIDILNPHDQTSYRVAYYFKKGVKNAPSVWMMNDMPTKTWFYWRESRFDPTKKPPLLKYVLYWLLDWYETHTFIKAQDTVMVLDFRDRDWVREYFGKDAIVIRNGADLSQYRYRERSIGTRRPIKLLMHGIFFNHRRFEDGLLSLKQLLDRGYDIRLSIAGDYNADKKYYARIAHMVEELELSSRVDFLGIFATNEKLFECFDSHDIFIFPNHLQSWGIVPFEAMATGLPVIVSRGAGASEILSHGENAMLVDPLSPDQIVGAVSRLIDDEHLYADLSANGRKFVEKNISWEKYAKDMFKIFEETINHKPF